MNIRFLETFVWLVRERSFRATAEKLNTTQPNISSRIAALEDHFRTKLYERGTKDFKLTPAGRRLFEHAERIVEMSRQMTGDVRAAESTSASLRVGIMEIVTLSWLPQLVQRIRSSDLFSHVDFHTDTSAMLVQMLRKGELDLVFSWGPANEPNVINDYVCTYAVAWMGHQSFANDVHEMDVLDVARLPIVYSKKDASDRLVVSEYFASHGLQAPISAESRVRLSSYSLATSTQIIRTGLGVMAMAPLVMADELRAGSVAILPVKPPLPATHVVACHSSDLPRPHVKQLVEMARDSAVEFARTAHPDHFWI